MVDYLTGHGWRMSARNRPRCSPATVASSANAKRSRRCELASITATRSHKKGDARHGTNRRRHLGPGLQRRSDGNGSRRVRAMASKGPDALLDDPWADPLVRAVGIDTFVKLIDGQPDDTDDRRSTCACHDRADDRAHPLRRLARRGDRFRYTTGQ